MDYLAVFGGLFAVALLFAGIRALLNGRKSNRKAVTIVSLN